MVFLHDVVVCLQDQQGFEVLLDLLLIESALG